MAIIYDDQRRQFHLTNGQLSLVITLHELADGSVQPVMRHFGAPLKNPAFDALVYRTSSFDTPNTLLPFAIPTGGHGDFRPTQLTAIDSTGCGCTRLTYASHDIRTGKRTLAGLPATYVERDDEAQTLTLHCRDEYTGLCVALSYTLFSDRPIIAVSTLIENGGNEPLILSEAASATLSLPGAWEMLHLHGAWVRERHVERISAMHGERAIRSKRGASGHQHNPFCALLKKDTTEFSGEAIGCSLVYSGNFRIAVDGDGYDQTRLVVGLDEGGFRWQLGVGESFQTPEAVLSYSDRGLNGMSQALHGLYAQRLCRGLWRDKDRPILVNNWEATYFDFDEPKLLSIAKTAAELGIELFVLDDGWFGKRDSDNSSLGDWFEHPKKLPQGLGHLSDEVHKLGLLFGVWFEPEMISPDSELFRAHPDWVLRAPGRHATEARQQWVLDMSNSDVQDYIIEIVCRRLKEGKIDYVKWDMNRNFCEYAHMGEQPHRYMLGLYRALEEITKRNPNVLFESCSGGGGRFDPGMLYYMPQTWTSDDSDAVERLQIQYGTSIAYPSSAMGAHVSAVPNHQVGRNTGLKMRGDVAMGGAFGYELDLSKLDTDERAAFAAQVAQAKSIRTITREGRFTRLQSPFQDNVTAWSFQRGDDVVAFAFQVLQRPCNLPMRLRLWGIEDGTYACEDTATEYDAAYLRDVGIEVRFDDPSKGTVGDFMSAMLRLKRKSV